MRERERERKRKISGNLTALMCTEVHVISTTCMYMYFAMAIIAPPTKTNKHITYNIMYTSLFFLPRWLAGRGPV